MMNRDYLVEKVAIKKPFSGFNEFKRRITNKFLVEETSDKIRMALLCVSKVPRKK